MLLWNTSYAILQREFLLTVYKDIRSIRSSVAGRCSCRTADGTTAPSCGSLLAQRRVHVVPTVCSRSSSPPSLLLSHSLSLSAYSIHLSIFHKHQQSLHQSPRYERYHGAKHGTTAPRRTGLRCCTPLCLSVDRLGLDGTAGTRALWQRGFKPTRRGGRYVWHGRRTRRLPAGLTERRWRGSRGRGELTPLKESTVPGKTNVPAQQLVRA